jgi:hypothetical protein
MSTNGVTCSEWSAWYDDMPGPDPNPELHVSAQCKFSSGSIKWTLEPDNEGPVDDPSLLVLRFTAKVPEAGTDDYVEKEITWRDDVGPDIKRVEIRGDASAKIKVQRVS